jgi:hypothetical protein
MPTSCSWYISRGMSGDVVAVLPIEGHEVGFGTSSWEPTANIPLDWQVLAAMAVYLF